MNFGQAINGCGFSAFVTGINYCWRIATFPPGILYGSIVRKNGIGPAFFRELWNQQVCLHQHSVGCYTNTVHMRNHHRTETTHRDNSPRNPFYSLLLVRIMVCFQLKRILQGFPKEGEFLRVPLSKALLTSLLSWIRIVWLYEYAPYNNLLKHSAPSETMEGEKTFLQLISFQLVPS